MADTTRDILLKLKFDTGEVESQVTSIKQNIQSISDIPLDSFDKLKSDLREAERSARDIGLNFGTSSKEFNQAKQTVDDIKSRITDVNKALNTTGNVSTRNLTRELRLAEREAIAIGEAVGTSDPKFRAAVARVQELKGAVGDVRGVLENLDPDNSLKGIQTFAQGAIGAVQGVAGAFALVGVEAEQSNAIIAKLQGLQAIASAVGSIDEIKDSFSALAVQLGLTQRANTGNVGAATANATATAASGVAATGASAAFITLRTVLVSLGIGAIVVAIGALIANFDKLTNAIGLTTENQKDLNEATQEGNKQQAEAIANVTKVKIAFDQAKSGVISKKDALNIYNQTLGDTLGKTDNLGVAEDRLNKKAEAYIKVARLKAEANILIAKAAEAAAKGSTAGLEDQTSFWDKIVISFNSAVFGVAAGATKAIESQIEGVKDAQNEAVVVSDALNKLAKQRADEAARISQEAGLITPGQDKPTGAKTDPAIENTKRLQEELNKITRENETKRRLEAIASEEEKEKELVRINLEYEKKRIEKTKADAQVKKALVIQLEAEAQSKIQEITKKYDDRREQAVKEVEAKIAAIREENALASINNEYDKREELIRKRENALIEEIKNNATLTETERQKAIIAVIDAFTPQYKKNDGDRLISGLNVNNELMNSDTIFFGKRATDLKQDAAKLKEWLDSGKITIEQYKTAIKSIGQAQDDNFKAGLRFYGELAQSLSQLVGGLADDEGKSAAKRKRLQVQAAIINTLGGIAIALGSAEPPRNFIQAAIVGAAGFLNVAKIKSTPITDGTKTYDGGGGGGATPSAPVNVAPALTQSLLGQATTQNVRVVNQQNQAVVRAYVTQDDLKRSQDKSDFLNKLSSF